MNHGSTASEKNLVVKSRHRNEWFLFLSSKKLFQVMLGVFSRTPERLFHLSMTEPLLSRRKEERTPTAGA